jgi:hypothetical protein
VRTGSGRNCRFSRRSAACSARHRFQQQAEPLRRQFRDLVRHARDVALGPRQAFDEALAQRVADHRHDDRDRTAGLLRGTRTRRVDGDDDIRAAQRKLAAHRRQAVELRICGAHDELEVDPFNVAVLAQSFPECNVTPLLGRGSEHPHDRLAGRLRGGPPGGCKQTERGRRGDAVTPAADTGLQLSGSCHRDRVNCEPQSALR